MTETRDTWELSMACSTSLNTRHESLNASNKHESLHEAAVAAGHLKLDAGVGAVPGRLVQQVLQGLQHLAVAQVFSSSKTPCEHKNKPAAQTAGEDPSRSNSIGKIHPSGKIAGTF